MEGFHDAVGPFWLTGRKVNMRCPNCRRKLRKNARYCTFCGTEIKESSGARFLSVILIVVLLISIAATGLAAWELATQYYGGKDPSDSIFSKLLSVFSKEGDTSSDESDSIAPPDAEDYFENNATVISVIDAAESEKVLTEAEVYDVLSNRGFTQYSITSTYSMTGEYSDESDITETSSSKHPIYETYYISENGDIWTILSINGSIFANPVSYNLQSELGVQVIVSESETVMSYDCITNKFFETIPDKSALLVITVNKINAELLDTLTIEEIDRYV